MKNYILRAEVYKEDKIIPIVIELNYDENDFKPAQCKILVDGDNYDNFSRSVLSDGTIPIRSTESNGEKFWIRFSRTGTRNHAIVGDAYILIKSLSNDLSISSNKITCHLTIPSTSLSPFDEFSDINKQINYWRKPETTGIFWYTELGQAELIRTFSYRSVDSVLHSGRFETFKYAIKIEINSIDFANVEDLIESLIYKLEDGFLILSFLSMKRIIWYEANIDLNINNSMQFFDVRRKVFLGKNPKYDRDKDTIHNLFVIPEFLLDGKFNQLVANYKHSDHKDTILQVIQLLLTSYEETENYVQVEYGLLWVAFEILVGKLMISNEKIVNSSKFKKIQKKLKNLLRDELNDNQFKNMITKIPELQRNSFKTRLFVLFENYAIDPSIFWPEYTQETMRLKEEIQNFVKRRNTYIHAGELSDTKLVVRDISRIRFICTYIILNLLDYPMDKINEDNLDILLSRKTP